MYGLIYCATNTVNGKQYVGQTTLTLARRWQGHCKAARLGFKHAFPCAIRKYGIEAFTIQQIDVAESQDELNEKEIHHVARLGTYGGGYNLTPGGEGFKVSEETRQKISLARQQHVGWHHSEETKQKISAQNWHHSEETRQKLSIVLSQVSCKRGHSFDDTNTYITSKGTKYCLTCHYLRHGLKLPQKLEKYVGKEIAHV